MIEEQKATQKDLKADNVRLSVKSSPELPKGKIIEVDETLEAAI